jgi:tetratricopeptide (TPR) repeat protein
MGSMRATSSLQTSSGGSRDRGRLLTIDGLMRLKQAIRDWEILHDKRCTHERMRDLTAEHKERGLDPSTISKILKGKEAVDPDSIHYLFLAFQLTLTEADLTAPSTVPLPKDVNFVGREKAIADLQVLVEQNIKVILLQAKGGVGKTTLARKFLQQEVTRFLEIPIAKETKDIASVESLLEEKLRQLGEEPGREFLVSIDRLKCKLQTERIGILIDNLEPILDPSGRFIEAHRRYVELIRVLTDPSVRSLTLMTSRERLHEPDVTVHHYALKCIPVEGWTQFFQMRRLTTPQRELELLYHAYGGNAKAMEIISGAIAHEYQSDTELYWADNRDDLLGARDLEELVIQQFDRLQAQDIFAYNLLCRMGCYRYQDVANVTQDGLFALLWDVPDRRKKRTVRALQDRSLIEVEEGHYALHPVLRAEAITRLRDGEDWITANQKAAEYWTDSVRSISRVGDALQAFEAYYHHLELNDSEAASQVILYKRSLDRRNLGLSLGSSFYRLGLVQQIIEGINQILPDLSSDSLRAQLYSTLANANSIIGNIQEGIKYQELSIESVRLAGLNHESGSPPIHHRRRELYSLLSIGLYRIDLWDLRQATRIFEKIIEQSQQLGLDSLTAKAECHLAFIKSCTGESEVAIALIDKAHQFIDQFHSSEDEPISHGFLYHLWALGSACKNIGLLDQAQSNYRRILSALETLEQPEIQAKTLTGLAELCRARADYSTAILHHHNAIALLEKIEAKCQLAEAHYQLGRTLKGSGAIDTAVEMAFHFSEAARLFNEVGAPLQVAKMKDSTTQLG